MHCVVQTNAFATAAKAAKLTEDEIHDIVTYVSENPTAGDVIKGTGGARKLRFPFRGRGKRGGIRTITFYAADDVPVFLLDVFVKGERVDLSQAERNELKRHLEGVADDYRESNRAKLADMRKRSA